MIRDAARTDDAQLTAATGRIAAAVASLRDRGQPVVLAVSGGVDSMVLLHAAARHSALHAARHRMIVATFDHGTGSHSTAAADLVEHAATVTGMACVRGRIASGVARSEAGWREARWRFLAEVAATHGAVVATAHTRDDQVETVLFRAMRGAGARGLAGLRAGSAVLRPLLAITRAEIDQYAVGEGVAWVEDPTNASSAHARNRLRHDLLPALRQVDPAIDEALLEIGERAARWRSEIREAVSRVFPVQVDDAGTAMHVPVARWHGLDDATIAMVWPQLLSHLGIAADWRGTRRLVAFTTSGRIGSRIQLSGGWVVHRTASHFTVDRHAGD